MTGLDAVLTSGMTTTDRDWIHCIDAPTLRATSRVDSELFKLREATQQRLAIIDKRYDWLQDACSPIYEADEAGEEETPRDKRVLALCERAQRHHEELEWRIKQIDAATTIMEEIGEFVHTVADDNQRKRRQRAQEAV